MSRSRVWQRHMLTYAFDLLFPIYEEEGYAPIRDPALILENNLYGLEICPRAAHLPNWPSFKAREKSPRFIKPAISSRPTSSPCTMCALMTTNLTITLPRSTSATSSMSRCLSSSHQFEEATTFGSLIQPCLDDGDIAYVRLAIEAKDLGGQLFLRETHLKVLRVLEQAETLSQRYHVVVANPPYMGAAAMNPKLKSFIESNWKAGKADTYSAFILRNLLLAVAGGRVAMITIPNWMFFENI